MAERTTEKGQGAALQATASAHGMAEGEEQLLTLARGNMEGLVRANQALVDNTSELSRAWLAFWQEQLAEGAEVTRELLERQGAFVRSSLERMNAQARRSAELTSSMIGSCFVPLRESKAAEQTSKHAA